MPEFGVNDCIRMYGKRNIKMAGMKCVKTKRISVIVPIYNVENYLEQCIDSILKQTYTNLEIILVDDGSADRSSAICDKYALNDNRIKVIHKANGGLVSARKAGVMEANGEYITFVDGDDWIEINTYWRLTQIGQGVDIIAYTCYEEYGDYHIFKENKVQEGLYVLKNDKEVLYETMFMNNCFFEFGVSPSLCTKLIRRDILKNNQIKVNDLISYGEDVACTYPCLLDASTICITNLPLYHYRQRQGSIVKNSNILPRSNFIELYKRLHGKFVESSFNGGNMDKQLHYYMWFTLLVKAYGDFKTNMFLFPFSKVRMGTRIAVYGAGSFGRVIKEFWEHSSGCGVIGWFDLHYETYQKQGIDVVCIDGLHQLEFDCLVIAILNETLAEKIKEDLVIMGIPEAKIDWVKKSVLEKTKLPSWVTGENGEIAI